MGRALANALVNYGRGLARALAKLARSIGQGLSGRGSLVLSLVIVVLLAGSYLFGTEQGRVTLTRTAVVLIQKFFPEINIHAGEIASPRLGSWYFSELAVDYRGELLVSARELALGLDLNGLTANKIDIERLRAQELVLDVDILRKLVDSLPDTEEQPEQDVPLELPMLRLQSLQVDRLQIIDSNHPKLPSVSVSADGSYRWPEQLSLLNFELREIGGAGLAFTLRGTEPQPQRYQLEFTAEEKSGGFVGTLLQLPQGNALSARGKINLWQPDDNQLLVHVEEFALPLVEHQFALSGRAAVTLNPWKVASEGLLLRVDDSEHRIAGNISGEQVEAEVHLDRLPVAISQPWQDYLRGGWLSADLKVQGPLALPEVNGSLELRSTYSGQPLHVQSEVRTEDKVIHLRAAKIQLADAELSAGGSVDIGNESIDLSGRIQQLELDSVRELLAALPETEGVEIPADLQGRIGDLQISAKGPWKNPQLQAKLDGSAVYREIDAQLRGVARGDLKKITLSELALESEQLRVGGGGTVNIASESLQLQLDVAVSDLRPAEQLGLAVDENTRVNLNAAVTVKGPWANPQLSARIESEGDYRDYRFTLRGSAAGDVKKIALDRLRLDLFRDEPSLVDEEPLGGPQSLIAEDESTTPEEEQREARVAALAADTEQVRREGSAWLEIDGVIEPRAQRAQGTVAARNIPVTLAELAGVALPPSLDGEISIDGQFSGPFSKPEASANLLGLGSFRNEPWQLQGDIAYGAGRIQLSQVELLWAARNQLSVDGTLSEQELDLQLRGQARLADLELGLTGELSDRGEITLWATAAGSPQQPQLNGELKLSSGADPVRGQPLNLLLDWHTDAGMLLMNLDASHGSRSAIDAEGQLAIAPILEQLFAPAPASGEKPPLPLKVSARGAADLDAVAEFLDPEIHRMRGQLQFNFQGDGNFNQPNMRGRIDLVDGYYEHRPSSTKLRRIVFAAELTPDAWRIERARAEDGEKGYVSIDGAVTFPGGVPPQLNFQLTADRAHLLNMPAARGAFSGELALTGSTEKANLAGQLTLRPLSVQIEHLFGGSIPEIEVIEVEVDGPQVERAPPLLGNIALAIRIVVDKQSYVRGLGLDSQLRGQVDIGGTAAEPQAGGELRIVRGSFDLFGKKFELQEGQIQFENNEVAIYVKGVYEHSEGEITAEISGTSNDVDITFSSEPEAAQDEIFAQLLFGKSLTDISPLQAVRLVSVVRTLQSGGSAMDPVAKTRELLGVDTLDIEQEDTDDGEQYALSLGKYITNRIYIELQRSTDPLNPWQAEMQIELRRNLNLEIKSAQEGESGAGSVELQWKRDY